MLAEKKRKKKQGENEVSNFVFRYVSLRAISFLENNFPVAPALINTFVK